jgi:hypothetical protein
MRGARRDIAALCEHRVGRAFAVSTICVDDTRHKVRANEVALVAAFTRVALQVASQP